MVEPPLIGRLHHTTIPLIRQQNGRAVALRRHG